MTVNVNAFPGAGRLWPSSLDFLRSSTPTKTVSPVPAGPLMSEPLASQQVLRRAVDHIHTLDPHLAMKPAELLVLADLYTGLVVMDDISGVLLPALAQQVFAEVQEDNTIPFVRWQAILRPDLKWSNGDPLTAQDFVFSIQRVFTKGLNSPYVQLIIDSGIKNAEAVARGELALHELGVETTNNGRDLVFTVNRQKSEFPYFLTSPAFLPLHVNQRDSSQQPKEWVSNGAYRLTQEKNAPEAHQLFDPERWMADATTLTMSRNPFFWVSQPATTIVERARRWGGGIRQAVPVIQEVSYLIDLPTEEMLTKFKQGEIDVINRHVSTEIMRTIESYAQQEGINVQVDPTVQQCVSDHTAHIVGPVKAFDANQSFHLINDILGTSGHSQMPRLFMHSGGAECSPAIILINKHVAAFLFPLTDRAASSERDRLIHTQAAYPSASFMYYRLAR